jgi:hypothetical protein
MGRRKCNVKKYRRDPNRHYCCSHPYRKEEDESEIFAASTNDIVVDGMVTSCGVIRRTINGVANFFFTPVVRGISGTIWLTGAPIRLVIENEVNN